MCILSRLNNCQQLDNLLFASTLSHYLILLTQIINLKYFYMNLCKKRLFKKYLMTNITLVTPYYKNVH